MSAAQAAALIAARAAKIKNILAVYGTPVTYTRASGGSLAITAALSSGDAVENAGAEYRAFLQVADFAGVPPVKGDSIAVGLVSYRVVDVGHPNEDGAISLALRKVT